MIFGLILNFCAFKVFCYYSINIYFFVQIL